MKNLLKNIFINFISFWIIAEFTESIYYSGKVSVILIASVVLSFINLLIKPILNLLFLPLNLLTMGAFRWIINAITLYLVTLFVPEFQIKPFTFPGVNFYGFVIPVLHFNLFFTLIFISFILAIMSNFTISLFK